MASKTAGNTGIKNELVSVCGELLRQNVTDKHKYKIIMLQLRNANNKKNLPKNTSLEELVSSISSRTFLQEYFRIMRKSKLT